MNIVKFGCKITSTDASRNFQASQTTGNYYYFVTHDQTEAMTLGTRIVVMKDGVVQQIDTHTIYITNLKTCLLQDLLDHHR